MARKVLTGDKELEKTLKELGDKAADRVAKSVLNAGLTPVVKEAKKRAPGSIKNAIGKRNTRDRKGQHEAKAGIGVGKRKSIKKSKGSLARQKAIASNTSMNAPHAHLVALGTVARKRQRIGGKFSYLNNPSDRQLSTGTMPANPFFRKAYEATKGTAAERMKKQAEKALEREAIKAAKRNRSNR